MARRSRAQVSPLQLPAHGPGSTQLACTTDAPPIVCRPDQMWRCAPQAKRTLRSFCRWWRVRTRISLSSRRHHSMRGADPSAGWLACLKRGPQQSQLPKRIADAHTTSWKLAMSSWRNRTEFEGHSPPREEGWLRHQENFGEANLSAADGVVALKPCIGVTDHPGRCRGHPSSRGGEYMYPTIPRNRCRQSLGGVPAPTLDLIHHLREVATRGGLHRRECLEGLKPVQPKLLTDGQHVPVV